MAGDRPWERAVSEAGDCAPADLAGAAREELAALWCDLDTARCYAYRGAWSVQCDDLVTRIVRLTRLAGVTPWDQVQCGLLVDGVYQGVLTAAGIGFAEPDMAQVRALHEQIRSGSVPIRSGSRT
jgi:hypothetical protein